MSEDSTQVVYAGPPLTSGRRYYWKVRYWDQEGGVSRYSEPAWFEMGLLSRDEWKGYWVSGVQAGGMSVPACTAETSCEKNFRYPAEWRARGFTSRLSDTTSSELTVNGLATEYSIRPLPPTRSECFTHSYDVTPMLHSGPNAIAVMLGGGWATLEVPRGGFERYYDSPALLLELNVEL